MLHLPGHDRLRHAGRLERLDALGELTERQPGEGRAGLARRGVGKVRPGLLLHRNNRDVVAQLPGGVEHEQREPAVAGDEAKTHREGSRLEA